MTAALSMLCRVVQRRVCKGESLDKILMDYPRLTDQERDIVRAACES